MLSVANCFSMRAAVDARPDGVGGTASVPKISASSWRNRLEGSFKILSVFSLWQYTISQNRSPFSAKY